MGLKPLCSEYIGSDAISSAERIVSYTQGSDILAKYDPAPNLARIKVPMLAPYGSLDLWVPRRKTRRRSARRWAVSRTHGG